MSITKFEFPVGYINFHKNPTINFQLNRWHSFGYARRKDLEKVAQKIEGFDDWTPKLLELAEEAENDNRMMNAGFYYRAAEFYISPGDEQKPIVYDKFKNIMKKLMLNDGIELIDVPYNDSHLPCLKREAIEKSKGTIVMHGGFDSFREEFFSAINYFADKSYDVIVFDGPGQGSARRDHDVAFDYRWEMPVKAVLDYFKLDDVTLFGVSMGGYLCFRAAAFEPRIKRVIASSVAYDYTDFPAKILQPIVHLFYHRLTNFTNNATIKEIEKGGFKSWYFSNLIYMQKAKRPIDAIQYLTEMNAEALHCENITQDVLILTGYDDAMVPFKMHKKQVDALTNAHSVTDKVFYEDTHASHHCQIGNMELNFRTIYDWIESVQ